MGAGAIVRGPFWPVACTLTGYRAGSWYEPPGGLETRKRAYCYSLDTKGVTGRYRLLQSETIPFRVERGHKRESAWDELPDEFDVRSGKRHHAGAVSDTKPRHLASKLFEGVQAFGKETGRRNTIQ
jgi:hypothetical protein